MANQTRPASELPAAMRTAMPELGTLTEAAAGVPVYLVGGAVRDLALGLDRSDVDVVVEGDAIAVARRLGGEVVEHERFATAKARIGGLEVDLAGARAESYARPGALPEVRAAGLADDLGRRDFTINAMAIPIEAERPELIDPHQGLADLEAGLLRVLHERSFEDDPTRALRAARYAARFGFELEAGTAELLHHADLGTVSEDRRDAELSRIAAAESARRGFELLAGWGLVELRDGAVRLIAVVDELLAGPPWSEVAERPGAILAAAVGPPGPEADLAGARPAKPSQAVELARGASPEELVLARALGAEWLDRYIAEWRSIVLEVGGDELLAAGVPEGPAVGRGLAEALRQKLDGEIIGRDEELAAALEAANALD